MAGCVLGFFGCFVGIFVLADCVSCLGGFMGMCQFGLFGFLGFFCDFFFLITIIILKILLLLLFVIFYYYSRVKIFPHHPHRDCIDAQIFFGEKKRGRGYGHQQ